MTVAMNRRTLVKGMAAGMPLAAVLADPALARAAAGTLDTVNLTSEGGRPVQAALALPASTPAPAIVLIHEWWGLNDQIKSVAAELARVGYVGLAVDLYNAEATTSPDRARMLMEILDPAAATDTVVSWIHWLKAHPKGHRQGRRRGLVLWRRLVAERLHCRSGERHRRLLRPCR